MTRTKDITAVIDEAPLESVWTRGIEKVRICGHAEMYMTSEVLVLYTQTTSVLPRLVPTACPADEFFDEYERMPMR